MSELILCNINLFFPMAFLSDLFSGGGRGGVLFTCVLALQYGLGMGVQNCMV